VRISTIHSIIKYGGNEEKLWYSIDKKYSRYLTTDKLDGFVVGLLSLAMELGEDIVVKGALSEKLFHNLSNYYIPILQLAIPSLKPVKIIPDSLDDGTKYHCEGAVGTGFSGGIDSFYTVLKYLLGDAVLPSYKITHLLFRYVGYHHRQEGRQIFESRYNSIKGFPEAMGIDFIKIDSNLDDFLRLSFEKTHQMRTLSCSLLLQRLFSKYYFSSGDSYKDSFTRNTKYKKDIDFTDPSAVHLLSTETLECILSGAQYSRVEKTRQIALSGVANKWLNVCTTSKDGRNCSMCLKCCRTLFTCELLGVISKFSSVFNLDNYKKARNYYIVNWILRNGDPLAGEIKEYAASIGYSFPAWQRLLALVLDFKPVRKLAKAGYNIFNKTR
jgi:serine/threonine protein kinase